jgi:hypothetical protein
VPPPPALDVTSVPGHRSRRRAVLSSRQAEGVLRLPRCSGLDGGSGAAGTAASAQRPVSARTGGRSVQTGGGPPASPSPASSRVSNNRIYRGVFGLAGGFGAPGCTKSSTEPKSSRTLTPQSARAPRHAQGPAPPGNDNSQDRHDRHPARACPTAPGARRQELPAVSHADQSWIIASVLSRRPEGR